MRMRIAHAEGCIVKTIKSAIGILLMVAGLLAGLVLTAPASQAIAGSAIENTGGSGDPAMGGDVTGTASAAVVLRSRTLASYADAAAIAAAVTCSAAYDSYVTTAGSGTSDNGAWAYACTDPGGGYAWTAYGVPDQANSNQLAAFVAGGQSGFTVDAGGGAFDITLTACPAAGGSFNYETVISRVDAVPANAVTILAAQQIESTAGGTGIPLLPGATVRLACDSTQWRIRYWENRTAVAVGTGASNVSASPQHVRVTAGAGGATPTLPACAGAMIGREITVKLLDANTVTVTRAGADLIDGATTSAWNTQYEARTFRCAVAGAWDVL